MENANLWTRRSNNGKLSLSMKDADKDSSTKSESPRSFANRRFGGDNSSNAKSNPFNSITTPSTASPSAASSAFGLGSGAFASFGSSAKTPKTPGTGAGFDFSSRAKEKENNTEVANDKTKGDNASRTEDASEPSDHLLKSTWTVFYRPPTNKYSDYEKSTIKIANISTVESFWTIYSHLKRPSSLPSVSDYHIFKEGIRPVWEDEANKRGGKWIIRLKKGVADRYWEDLLLAIVGDQFMEAGEEVCGAVLSVRSGEDVLSVWTKIDGGRNIKIRYA